MSLPLRAMVSYQSRDTASTDLIQQELRLRGFETIRDQDSFVRGQRLGTSMHHGVTTCDAFVVLLTPNSLYLEAGADASRPVLDDEIVPAMARRSQHEADLREESRFTPAAVRPLIYPIVIGLGDRQEAAQQLRRATGLDLSSMWTTAPFQNGAFDQPAAAAAAAELLSSLLPPLESQVSLGIATRGTALPEVDLLVDGLGLVGGQVRQAGSVEDWLRVLAGLRDLESAIAGRAAAREIVVTAQCHLTAAVATGRVFNQAAGWRLTVNGRHGVVSRPVRADRSCASVHWEEGNRRSRTATVEIDLIGHPVNEMVSQELRRWEDGPRGRLQVRSKKEGDLLPDEIAGISRAVADDVRAHAGAERLDALHVFVAAPADFAVLLGHQLTGVDLEVHLYERDGSEYLPSLCIPASLP